MKKSFIIIIVFALCYTACTTIKPITTNPNTNPVVTDTTLRNGEKVVNPNKQ